MKKNYRLPLFALAGSILLMQVGCASQKAQADKEDQTFQWRAFNSAAFEDAKRENKLVLINVATTWCHWCHVMDEKTYAHPEVLDLLKKHVVAIRVDADAHPDLAERYRDWGWPATALLTPRGQALAELRGYQAPERFLSFLRGYIEDLKAGKKLTRKKRLPPDPEQSARNDDIEEVGALLVAQLEGLFDQKEAGWSGPKKYPLLAPLEHLWWRAHVGAEKGAEKKMADTLDGMAHLMDPVWGGMYQYSTGWVWEKPHFEKLAFIQARGIEAFILGHHLRGEGNGQSHDLKVARHIADYLVRFMRDEGGAFYANQDADLGSHGGGPHLKGAEYYALSEKDRLALGQPFIDRNIFASHNGHIIQALVRLYMVTGEARYLAHAERAAATILATHFNAEEGAFAHAHPASGRLFHLDDQVSMGRAFLLLAQATGDKVWLKRAEEVAATLRTRLWDAQGGGYFAHTESAVKAGVFGQRRKPFIQNSQAARFHFLLESLSGDKKSGEMGMAILRYFSRPDFLRSQNRVVGDFLMAVQEASVPAVHFTVVGPPSDPRTQTLYLASLQIRDPRRIVERGEPGGKFPMEPQSALYICGENFCSTPITDPNTVEESARAFLPRLEILTDAPPTLPATLGNEKTPGP
jgi:uncharacterized protein YyaL (SSP411 family)